MSRLAWAASSASTPSSANRSHSVRSTASPSSLSSSAVRSGSARSSPSKEPSESTRDSPTFTPTPSASKLVRLVPSGPRSRVITTLSMPSEKCGSANPTFVSVAPFADHWSSPNWRIASART